MDVLERKVENQVQFWSLVGPFLILLSTAILLFKVSVHWYFPVSALIGIPLCVKWKMKGMAAALSSLLFFSVLAYQNLELDERYWHVGMALAMAFSFIVLTLSLEEVQYLVGKLELESQSRLDNFLKLDEKWKEAEQAWNGERERTQAEMDALAQEMAKVQEEKQTFYKLAQLAKEELVQIRVQHELLLKELFYKKQQVAQLHERLEETEMTIQGFLNSDAEKQIQHLTESVAHLEQEKETVKAQMALAQKEYRECLQEKEAYWQELQERQERETRLLAEQQQNQQDKRDQQEALQEQQKRCTLLEQEKNALSQALASLHQQYQHMRHAESQQRQTLQVDQNKIQGLEAKLAAESQQCEILRQQIKQLEDQLKQQEEQSQGRLRQVQGQLSEQERLRELKLMQAQKDLWQTQQALQAKEDQLQHIQEQVQSFRKELHVQREISQKATEQLQTVEQLKMQLEVALKEVQGQLEQPQQRLELAYKGREKSPYADGNTRRIESMYIQLKEQFQEKSAILDETRRELFHAHEELLKVQKEREEEQIFEQTQEERDLQRELLFLGQQYEQMQRQYQQELDDLTDLISHLMSQMET